MKTIKFNSVLFLALILGLTLNTGKVIAQDQAAMPAMEEAQAPAQEMDPKMAAMMEKFKAYSTPTENHRALDILIGNWDYTIKWWMAADKTPEESVGVSEVTWILNGRFLSQKINGTSMGQPFEGIGIVGYNNLKKTYETIWIDNMATGMMIGTGQFNAANKTMMEEGNFSCPLVDGTRGYRTTMKIQDNDHYSYEMYMTDVDSGKEFKAMEINYTRKSSKLQ